jgi:DNA-binding NtrC family response regulator
MEQAYPERIKGEFIKNDGLKIAVSRTRDLAEKEMLLNALEKTGNNKAMTAQLLKIGRTYLYRKLKRLGI